MRSVRFHEAAITEIVHETLYYRNVSKALGARFALTVEQATQLASEFPDMGSPYKHGTRRVFPRKFPFSLVYLVRVSEIYVLALAPQSKKPGYWHSRGDGQSGSQRLVLPERRSATPPTASRPPQERRAATAGQATRRIF